MVFFMCRYVCLFPVFESKDLHLCQTTLEKLQLLNLFCQKTLYLPSTERLIHRVTLVVGEQEAEAGESQIGQTVCVDGDLHVTK